MEGGVTVNEQDSEGVTPLMEVVMVDDYELALKLLQLGADPRIAMKNGTTVLETVDKYPLPANTPQGQAQREFLAKIQK